MSQFVSLPTLRVSCPGQENRVLLCWAVGKCTAASYLDYKSVLDVQRGLTFIVLFTLKMPKKTPQFLPFANLMLECRGFAARPNWVNVGEGGGTRGQGWTSAGGVMVISDALVGADLSGGAPGDVA